MRACIAIGLRRPSWSCSLGEPPSTPPPLTRHRTHSHVCNSERMIPQRQRGKAHACTCMYISCMYTHKPASLATSKTSPPNLTATFATESKHNPIMSHAHVANGTKTSPPTYCGAVTVTGARLSALHQNYTSAVEVHA